MRKLWGSGILIILVSVLLAGCHATSNQHSRTVQPATSKVTAVQRVHHSDFNGRWVSSTPAASLYLGHHHQAALFADGRQVARGGFTLKLFKNNQATLTIADQPSIKLTLKGATSMTSRQGRTHLDLTKDPTWNHQTGEIPASAQVALKKSTLTPTFRPSY